MGPSRSTAQAAVADRLASLEIWRRKQRHCPHAPGAVRSADLPALVAERAVVPVVVAEAVHV